MSEQNLAWLASELAGQLRGVLEAMAGEAPAAQFDRCELPPAGTDQEFLWWEQPFSLSPDAILWIGAGQPAWEKIGARVLRSAGVEEEDRDTSRSTYLEIVTQIVSGLAASMSSRLRQEVSPEEGHEAPPIAGSGCFSFQIAFPDLETNILAAFSGSLTNHICETAGSDKTDAPPPATAAPPAPPNPIDLLLDVELPVSVSFGRAQLPLKDVIKLTTGSIVELNRSVSEPVEVIVNNCVIARGEVVVVEGNFGIRIKQVISRQERLRTLY
jgi:flagellar motor switch protein FliN/FliY